MIAAAVALLLLASAEPETSDPAPPRVVLAGDAVAAVYKGGSENSLGAPYWSPTAAEIAEVEAALPGYLASAPEERAHVIPPKLGRYGRQYFGVTGRGRRVLVVNAFCSAMEGKDLSKRMVDVLDGGDCFFQAYYDMNAHRFAGLTVNGLA